MNKLKIILYFLLLTISGCVKSQPSKVVASAAKGSSGLFYSTYDLIFNESAFISNISQTFTASGGGFGYGHTGVDIRFLDSNVNGRVYSYLPTDAAAGAVLGFHTSFAQAGYASWKAGINRQASTNEFYSIQIGGVFASGYTVPNGKWFGILRCGASFKPQISDDGIVWQDLNIYRGYFTVSSHLAMYPVIDIHTTGSIVTPKLQVYNDKEFQNLIINNGNSIAYGVLNGSGTGSENNMGLQCWTALDANSDWFYNDFAVSGQDIDQGITQFPITTAPLFKSGFKKIIVTYLEGTNELAGAGTAPAAWTKMQTYIGLVLAADPRANIMVYMTPSTSPTLGVTNAKRMEFNDSLATLIGANPRIKIVDIRGDPILDGATSYSNTTYYWDGVHLTQAGLDYYASLSTAVIVTFGGYKYFIIIFLFAAVATRVEKKVVQMINYKQAA